MPQNSPNQGKVREFRWVKFIFSQFEDSNFENFLGEHGLMDTVNGLLLIVEF